MLYRHLVLASLALLAALQFPSCVSAPQAYPQGVLARQILVPRPGHDGKLTNQACVAFAKDGTCSQEIVLEYDLTQSSVRQELNNLNFICKMAGHRYKICTDKAGFCHETYKSCGLFGMDRCPVETFVPISSYQTILDSGIVCFNQSVYDFEEVE